MIKNVTKIHCHQRDKAYGKPIERQCRYRSMFGSVASLMTIHWFDYCMQCIKNLLCIAFNNGSNDRSVPHMYCTQEVHNFELIFGLKGIKTHDFFKTFFFRIILFKHFVLEICSEKRFLKKTKSWKTIILFTPLALIWIYFS